MRRAMIILLSAGLLAAGGVVAVALGGNGYGHVVSTITQTTGGGHTPVTICHKPGTPAEMTLVVDDDAVPGHIGHGDYLGKCQPPVTTTGTTGTTPTDTTPTTPTETTPTTPTETTPTTPPHEVTGAAGVYCDLPSQTYIVTGSIDGNAADGVTPATIPGTYHGWTNVTVHRGDTDFRTAVFTYGDCFKPLAGGETGAPVTPQSATTPSSSTTPPPVSPVSKSGGKTGTRNPATHKTVVSQPKLTGNPKTDECKDLGNGTMNCKGVIVTQGNG